MKYECWLESATSMQDLKEKLIKKGYTNLPNINYLLIESPETIEVNLDKQKLVKTMLRKTRS